MTTLDKFGRPPRSEGASAGSGERGPTGYGYEIDKEGNYTLKNKRLRLNRFDPVSSTEAINLATLRKFTLHNINSEGKIDAGKRVITRVATSNDPTSVVTKSYMDARYPLSVKTDHHGTVVLCGNKRLTGLRDGVNQHDGITLRQAEEYITVLRQSIIKEIKEASEQIRDAFTSLPSLVPTIPAVPHGVAN